MKHTSIHITGRRRYASGATILITRTLARRTATTGLAGSPAVSSSEPVPGTAEASMADLDSGLSGGTVVSDRLTIEVASDPSRTAVRWADSVEVTNADSRAAAFVAAIASAEAASKAAAASEAEATHVASPVAGPAAAVDSAEAEASTAVEVVPTVAADRTEGDTDKLSR
jgi:hypothetical protein